MKNTQATLASGILAGGLLFSGGVEAANVLVNSNFDGTAGVNQTDAWGTYSPYAQTYNGVTGPDLNLVTTVDYGYNDNITLNAGSTFMGLEQNAANLLSQTVSLTNGDVSAAEILAGDGRFAISGWLQTCCGDEPGIYLTFNDGANTAITLSSLSTTNQVTTADKEVNPGGANNTTSETSNGYWKFYEVKGIIPTDATMATVEVRLAPGAAAYGAHDLGSDLVILDTVAVPEPSFTALIGLGALATLFRRRR